MNARSSAGFPRHVSSRLVLAAACAFAAVVGLAQPVAAQDAAPKPPPPDRVGNDAPHQERNPTNRPEAYQIRRASTPGAVVETGPVTVKVGPEVPPSALTKTTTTKKKKGTAARRTRGNPTVVENRVVPVRKAEPVGPTPEEIAADREARQAELSRPTPIGSNGPHYERNGASDLSAGRIISIERN